jgi:hypothetical protein
VDRAKDRENKSNLRERKRTEAVSEMALLANVASQIAAAKKKTDEAKGRPNKTGAVKVSAQLDKLLVQLDK